MYMCVCVCMCACTYTHTFVIGLLSHPLITVVGLSVLLLSNLSKNMAIERVVQAHTICSVFIRYVYVLHFNVYKKLFLVKNQVKKYGTFLYIGSIIISYTPLHFKPTLKLGGSLYTGGRVPHTCYNMVNECIYKYLCQHSKQDRFIRWLHVSTYMP